MKPEQKMEAPSLSSVAEAFLAEREWDDVDRTELEAGQVSFSTTIYSEKQTYAIFIEVFPKAQCIGVFIYTDFCVGLGAMCEMALLLNHINQRVSNGWLSVEGEGSPIQFKQLFDSEGTVAAPKVIENMANCGFDTFSRFGAALAAVAMTGSTAAEAIARLDRHDELPDCPHEHAESGSKVRVH
jgi:hypothetical protein